MAKRSDIDIGLYIRSGRGLIVRGTISPHPLYEIRLPPWFQEYLPFLGLAWGICEILPVQEIECNRLKSIITTHWTGYWKESNLKEIGV